MSAPYYAEDGVTIWHADCRDVRGVRMNTCPDCGGVIGIECFPQPDGECLLTWLGRWNGDDPPSDCAYEWCCNGCLGRGSCSECYGTGHAHPHAARPGRPAPDTRTDRGEQVTDYGAAVKPGEVCDRIAESLAFREEQFRIQAAQLVAVADEIAAVRRDIVEYDGRHYRQWNPAHAQPSADHGDGSGAGGGAEGEGGK